MDLSLKVSALQHGTSKMLESMIMVLVRHRLLEIQDKSAKQIFMPCLEKKILKQKYSQTPPFVVSSHLMLSLCPISHYGLFRVQQMSDSEQRLRESMVTRR